VTGANHGIGAATAKALAAEGARVFITYFRMIPAVITDTPDEGGELLYAITRSLSAEMVLRDIRDAGGRAEAWETDLSDPEIIPKLFDRAEKAFDAPVEVVVNNAAYWEPDTFQPIKMTAQLWPPSEATFILNETSLDRHMMINARATALIMQEYARRHVARRAHWGRIINLSTDGAHCFPGEVSYGASKAALESLSRSAAAELGPFGITVNVVSPGPTQTGWISPELERELSAQTPLGRVGLPEDLADVIVFLASEQARWVTGQLMHVGGGHMI
jgi:3-oxoacyl-[acyl-carrier protein] reductase